MFARAQEINGIIYLRLSSLPTEGQEQLLGNQKSAYGMHQLLSGRFQVFEREAADGPEVWFSFSPQAAGKIRLKTSPATTSRTLEDLTVEFPAYQALDRCCILPPMSSYVVNF